MFKSVFAKYITAFMVIIIVSFAVLIGIISTVVNNYSVNAKADLVAQAAHTAAAYIEEKLQQTMGNDFVEFAAENEADISLMMQAVASTSEDITLLLTDNTGNILSYNDNDKSKLNVEATIPKSVMDEINNGQEVSQLDFLEGVFPEKHMIYAVPIYTADDYVCGTAMVCTTSVKLDNLLELMIKTIVVASLWIMLAALVAVYFITERVVRPLREMNRAVKCFAAGDFSARVPVRGKDEIARLAVAVNDMAQSLDNLEKMRNTFIGNVSHDLRTPMTTISGFIDGILDGAIPPEKHEYYLGIIATEVRRLSRLVATLLDVARLQAGDRKFNMKPFDICEMARQILISFEQKIDAKRLDVEFECDEEKMFANADRDAIYQILYNICDNAVKFSCERGKLSLTLRNTKDKKVLIRVFNEGVGIPPTDVPFIFERFYKSDKSRGLDKSGVGLGMFIAKTIIDAHHEKIWVESEYQKNCAFQFTLAKVDPPAGPNHLPEIEVYYGK